MPDATFSANAGAIAYASAKSMIDVANANTSAKTISAYSFVFFNNGTASVTGVLTTLEIQRHTTASPSGGSPITAVKHNNASANLDAGTTCGTGRTCVSSDVFRRIVWSNDEPAVGGASMDEWELQVSNATLWSAFGDTRIEPIVCRAGVSEGVQIKHTGSSAVGTADAEIIFTNT